MAKMHDFVYLFTVSSVAACPRCPDPLAPLKAMKKHEESLAIPTLGLDIQQQTPSINHAQHTTTGSCCGAFDF